jgi:hypothetical protein
MFPSPLDSPRRFVAQLAELEDAHHRFGRTGHVRIQGGVGARDDRLADHHELLLALAVEPRGKTA